MKKFIAISFIFILGAILPSFAFMPPNSHTNYINTEVNLGLNYNKNGRTYPQGHAINKIIISTGTPSEIITPPPPPPPRRTYRYKDFAGQRRFPARNYYIPSYCMPERGFNTGLYNPFCNQYRPYGSNMYISF